MSFLNNVIVPQSTRIGLPSVKSGGFFDNVVLPKDQEEADKIAMLQGQLQVSQQNADYAKSFRGLFRNTFTDISSKAMGLGRTGYEALVAPLEIAGQTGAELGTALREKKPAEAIAGGIRLGTSVVSAMFAPVNAAFAIAEKVPVLKQAAEILSLPFMVTGKIGEFAGDKFTNVLPISKEAKEILRPAITEAGSLVGQIWLGGKVIETLGRRGEIKKEDIEILKEQAKTITPETPTPPLPPNVVKGGFLDNVMMTEITKVSNELELGKEAKTIIESGGTTQRFDEFSNVIIRRVPKEQIRNNGVGDYKLTKDGGIEILVSNKLDTTEFKKVAIHELIESNFAKKRGISFEEINKFDAKHIDAPQPGALKDAPYHEEHILANNFEKIFEREKIFPKAVDLPEIKPITIRPETKIYELKSEIAIMEQTLNENPIKKLSKYANKNGELPEVLGGVHGGKGAKSEFGIRGDDIVTELGFTDSESARAAYQQYHTSREKLNTLKEELKKVKGESFTDYTTEQIANINTLFNQTNEGIRALTPLPSTGKIMPSRLALRIEEGAIEKKITKSLGDLPEYNRVNLKEQAKLASDLITENPEYAMRIAMGEELPPHHILPESIFVGVENKAITAGDVVTLRMLATESNFSTQATAMGQRIRALGEREQESPVGIIRDVKKAREEKFEKRGGIEKVQKNTIDEIKTEIRKNISKRPSWEEFIRSIQCGY